MSTSRGPGNGFAAAQAQQSHQQQSASTGTASKQPAALPLPRHQAYGTVLVKVKRAVDAHNPKTGEATRALRSAIERVDGPVLELARTDALFPPDERL